MINAINNNTPITFQGKSYSKKIAKETQRLYERFSADTEFINPELFQTYKIKQYPKLEKFFFGYKFPNNSTELEEYMGSKVRTAGFSTESGGYGGGWIKAKTNIPLSTRDVHTCALVNLINENSGEQLLFHVYEKTKAPAIKELFEREFPRFNRVNIMPGDRFQTNTVINNIIDAVDDLNPKAVMNYYHTPIENPEVVAIDGGLKYIRNRNPERMTFVEITDQYHY